MGTLAAVAEALDRAERRMIKKAFRVWKKIQDQILRNVLEKTYEPVDVSPLSEAFKVGMIAAYVYGRADAQGKIRKKIMRLSEDFEIKEPLVEFILKQDGNLVRRLMGYKVTDAMAEFFQPSKEALNFLDGYTVKLAKVLEKDFLDNVTKWVQDTIREGMSEKEASRYLEQRIKNFTKHRINMIARTEATRAFNIGRLEETLDSDIVVGYRFDAVLDKKTSKICRARDGMFIPKTEKALLIENTPPLHPNCRSRLVEVTVFDDLPKKHMPKTWDVSLMPKQRIYDKNVLERILNKPERNLTAQDSIDWVIENLKGIEFKEKYTTKELRRIAGYIDPDNPNGAPKVELKKLGKGTAGQYKFRSIGNTIEDLGIEISSKTPDKVLSFIHESLHRQYITRYGNILPDDFEEGITDFLAKYIYSRSFKNMPAFSTGYKEYPLKLLLYAKRNNISLDSLARKLYQMRRKGAGYNDFIKKLGGLDNLSLTSDDLELVFTIAKKHLREVQFLMKEALLRQGALEAAADDIAKTMEKYLKDKETFENFWYTNDGRSFLLSQAIQYIILMR